MTDTPEIPEPQPIKIKATSAPIITDETFKAVVVGGGAFAADRLMHSEAAIMAALPVFAVVATVVWGLMQRLHTWKALKFLSNEVPDSVAIIGKKKPWWVFW